MKVALRYFAVAAVLALSGCSMFSSQKPRHVPAALGNYSPAINAKAVWSISPGGSAGVGFVPMASAQAVYVAGSNGSVGKYSLDTGAPIWTASARTALSAGPGTDGNITAVATPRGEIIAFDDKGGQKWKAQASSEVLVPPLVGGGLVVVRSTDYRIQAFDAATGERRWSVQRPGPALALRATSAMIMSGGFIFTGLPGGKMIAIDAASGAVRWEGTVALPSGITELDRVADVVGYPLLVGRLLCGVSYHGRINCFDVNSGASSWSREFSSVAGLGSDGRLVFAVNDAGIVYAFTLSSGAEAWKQEALGYRELSTPTAFGDAVAIGDYQGYVHFLDNADGHLLARVATDGSPIVAPPLATEKGLLVQTSKGRLVLIGAVAR